MSMMALLAKEDRAIYSKWQKKMFLHEEFSDCTIWVKTSNSCTRFPCHRAILAASSEVFSDILRTTQEKCSIIVIEDLSPKAMVVILKFWESVMSSTEEKQLEVKWQEKLFLSEKFSDCAIHVMTSDSYARYPCHKAILALASDTLAEMFESLPQENESIIVIDDMNPDAVVKVLEYMYLGHVEFEDWKLVTKVLKVASKYKILKLVLQCEDYLVKNVTLQNVCTILETAILSCSKTLEKATMSICRDAGFVILSTNAFLEVDLKTVKKILSISDLEIPNEMTAFKAAWKWATYKGCIEHVSVSDENVVNIMNSLFECIGFEFMSYEEIRSIPKVALKKLQQMFPNLELFISKDFSMSYDQKINNARISDPEINGHIKSTHTQNTVLCFALSLEQCVDETHSKQYMDERKKRKITFPLCLSDFHKEFQFDLKYDQAECLEGNLILMRFSVNSRAYLTAIDIVHGCGTVPYPCEDFSSLHVYNRSRILASFSDHSSDNLIHHNSVRGNLHNFSALELLVVEAREEYTIEVNHSNGVCNQFWPLASLLCKRLGNMEISFLTKRCYGIYRITFIEAS